MKISVFWFVKLCSLAKIHRHYGKKTEEKPDVSETSVNIYYNIRCLILEDDRKRNFLPTSVILRQQDEVNDVV